MDQSCYYRVSVKGIVIDEAGRILLAREDNGMWDMLGGGLDHGEDPVECLKREIYEESGLNVTRVSNNPRFFNTAPKLIGEGRTANVIYEIELESLEFTPSEECQELRFFSHDEIKNIQLFPNAQKLFESLSAAKQA